MRQSIKTLSKAKNKLAISIQQLFLSNNINALPMKLYSDDDDIDIVIIEKKQYKVAITILLANGWFCRNNRSKLRERDKDFFHHENIPYVVHLHQAFSWNTIIYLNSHTLWKRKRKVAGLFYPSIEDELLIIAAHSLFENQYIKKEELSYGRELLEYVHDMDYLESHAAVYHWEKGLVLIINKLKKNNSSLRIKELLGVKIGKLNQDFMFVSLNHYLIEILNYFCIDWIWNYRIMLQKKFLKLPIIITLSGVDGSGKTTGADALYQEFNNQGKRVKIIHPGTTPFVNPTTIARRFRWQISGNGAFAKDFAQIIFQLMSNINYEVIIFDRYIFDTLVKVTYKQQKKIFSKPLLWISLHLTPKPDLSFLFIVSPTTSHQRDKTHTIEYHKTKYALYQNISYFIPNCILVAAAEDKKRVDSFLKKKIRPLL